ncbi:MAG: ribonuclease III [Planctomycetes bacterium]|nr:ribonuclease III [Planctomycetota bacterium]
MAEQEKTDTLVQRVAQLMGYHFTNEQIITEALTHASSADHRLRSNERMEFLGDAILGYVVCGYIFKQYPELMEGELTKIKSAVVSRKVCAKISQDIGLVSVLTLGKGMTTRPGLPPSVIAAVLEAIIAAIYLDGGIEPARTFILKHMVPYIDDAAISAHQQNFKSVLQQHAQRNLPSHPQYTVLDEKGPDHSKCFEVCVEMDGRRFPSTWANSKKEAEQHAALLALKELGLAEVDAAGKVTLRNPPETAK